MTAMSFNELMRKRDPRNFYRLHKQDDAWIVDDPPDPRERPGDPGAAGADIEGNGDHHSVIECAARWLVRSNKKPGIDAAREWLNGKHGQSFLQRNAAHFGKRQRPAALRKMTPKPAAPVNITSADLVGAAKLHALAKHPKDAPDLAFTKMIADSTDEDGAAFRRVNAKLRRAELYPGSASPTPAYDALVAKAEALRNADPKLTKEQSFAKAYDGNPELREAERAERRRALGA
jgi:hypothetical protein